ncbi:MAG: hypothetical protein IJG36_09105 [Synergistaceae bacterium]|nr:hypothetical protein [Synergistaceae bacterium]
MEKELWFSEVDRAVTHDRTLSATDKSVYNALCYYADRDTRECSPKVAAIAVEASCSQRSVYRSLNVLEARGTIQRNHRFRRHRQIASLYIIIGYKAPCYSAADLDTTSGAHVPAENTYPINTVTEADCPADMDYHINTAADNAMPECQSVVTATDCHTVVSMTNWQSNHGVTDWQSEKTLLESFKDSIRGATLPALAEKDLDTISVTFPEEVNSAEETKDSLTGGALLPILECEKTENPEAPKSTSGETEETPFIRAESDGTTAADTDNAVCENPVIRAKCDGTASTAYAPTPEQMSQLVKQAPAPNANGEVVIPEIPEWLLKRYEEARKRYAELYKDDQPKAAEAPKKAEEAPVIPGMPEPGTTEYYQRKFENAGKAFPELCQPVKGPASVASLLGGVMDKIRKPKSGKSEATARENSSAQACETPVTETEAIGTCEHSNPAEASEKTAETPAPEVASVEPDDIPAPKTANPPDEQPAPETESDTPVKPKETSRKKPGKSSGGGSPKDRYSPDYAPEVMRPTAEYLLYKTGRKGLRWEEIEILRELSAIHYPTVVNKEIRRACERFEKKKEPLECLTMMYIAVGLRKWRSFGKKKAKSHSPTAEEKAQRQTEVRARIAELKEELGIEIDEEGNWIERKREDKTEQ